MLLTRKDQLGLRHSSEQRLVGIISLTYVKTTRRQDIAGLEVMCISSISSCFLHIPFSNPVLIFLKPADFKNNDYVYNYAYIHVVFNPSAHTQALTNYIWYLLVIIIIIYFLFKSIIISFSTLHR